VAHLNYTDTTITYILSTVESVIYCSLPKTSLPICDLTDRELVCQQIVVLITGEFAGKPTRGQTSRGLVN